MRITRLHALVALNAVLLGVLALVALAPRATAQDRQRASYILVPGSIPNNDAEAVWIVDETNQELIAVIWDNNRNELNGIGYRNLAVDAATLARTRSN